MSARPAVFIRLSIERDFGIFGEIVPPSVGNDDNVYDGSKCAKRDRSELLDDALINELIMLAVLKFENE